MDTVKGGRVDGTLMVETLKFEAQTADDRFDEIYLLHRPKLVRFARSRNAVDPEGIADLALFDGYRALDRLRSDRPEVLESYLFRAAHSHVLRERRKPHDEVRDVLDELRSEPFDERVVGDANVETMLNHLSDNQREVMRLRFVEQLNTVETASRMGKSEVAVRQLQARAVRRLRRMAFTAFVVVLAVLAAGAWILARSEPAMDTGPADRGADSSPGDQEQGLDQDGSEPAQLRVEVQDGEPTATATDTPTDATSGPATDNQTAETPTSDPSTTDTETADTQGLVPEPLDRGSTATPEPTTVGTAAAMTPRGVNLAHGRPVRVSSSYSTEERFAPANAVDGDRWTRWSSAYLDNEWLEIDLGRRYDIDRVFIEWEDAFASAYRVEVSDDQENWSEIYSTTTGDGQADDLVGLAGSGRYLRLVGERRATEYGISPWEVAVYGPADNLALFKPTRTSSVEDNNPNYVGVKAVDGDPSTRWSSGFLDDQQLEIDLGKSYQIGRIVITWDVARARAYRVEVSDNRAAWSVIYSTADGVGDVDDLSGLSASGRYVRLVAEERSTGWGVSIDEFQIFRP